MAGTFKFAIKKTVMKDFQVGVAEDVNRKCRRTMEDAHCYVYDYGDVKLQGFFAIYDGHAGKTAAEWCGSNLHNILLKNLNAPTDSPVPLVLHQTFVQTDDNLSSKNGIHSGCTAVVSVLKLETSNNVQERVLYTANVGDARAVLWLNYLLTDSRGKKAVRLSYDHKGSDPQEIKRIIDAGGFIMNHRVNGVLAVSRSLGDASMKDLIVSHPYTTEVILNNEDEFLVLACDGVWDVLTDNQVIEMVYNIQNAQEAAELIVKQALSHNSMDNISCMVIRFCDERPK